MYCSLFYTGYEPWDAHSAMAGSCGHGNEPSSSIKCGEFHD